MFPNQFVQSLVDSNQHGELIRMIGEFCRDMGSVDAVSMQANAFVKHFLTALMAEMKEKSGESLRQSPYFVVWADLGYVGVDRLRIMQILSERGLQGRDENGGNRL